MADFGRASSTWKPARARNLSRNFFKGVQAAFGGAVSPDEKRLAVMVMKQITEISEKQIILIDLTRKNVEKIGEPNDYASVHWLPNGKELLLERIEPEKRMEALVRKTIWIMNLKGETREIAKGREAMALPGGRILFERDDNKWVTVDGKGKSEKRFCKRLPDRCGFPAVSPDGKQVLFVQFGDAGPLGTVTVDI